MDPLNDTANDRELTREDRGELAAQDRERLRRWPSVVAGALALLGGAAIDLGLYRPFVTGIDRAFRDLVVWPDWRVRLGLSVAAGLFGLVAALLAGGAAGRTALGGLVVPSVLIVAINGAISAPMLEAAANAGSLSGVALGGWLTLGGSAAVLVAAVMALSQLGLGSGRAAAGGAGFLAVLGIGGLLYSWVVGSYGHRGVDPVTKYSYVTVLAGGDVHGWTAAAVLAGLALALGAIGLAAGRTGAVPAGVALGAGVAAGVDVVIRFLMSGKLRNQDILFPNNGGLDRSDASLIALAATALVLLLLAAVLRGRPDSDVDPSGFEPVPDDTELYDAGAFGNGRTYDSTERPFEQYTSGYGSRDPFQYLPERDTGATGRYPLVPDDNTGQHPRSALRPPQDP
jgi:hypothetical protein